ncbi:MAG: hypothetical protein KDI71_04585 [Xanthomonadales bacterium]|nr:hypothetical protein [Xanthomonadales bacterium]
MKINWAKTATELLTIIAGVLIALWIGELRQGYLDRQKEQEYLLRLAEDLGQDIDEIERVNRHIDGRVTAALNALRFLDSGPDASPLETTIGDFDRAGYITFFIHARSTWDDLAATGSLQLITDSTLRRSLSRYYRSTRFIDEFDESKIEQIWHGYRVELDNHLSPMLILDARRANGEGIDIDRVDLEALRGSRSLRIGLEKIIAMGEVEKRMVSNLGEQTSALLERVSELSAL